ncbi:MAG: urease accessory protein UreF [Candidatus Reconcilbacillus cellulovorans]|uniref:Urease accessory protein UreF n=1 Tax=Candidatus Reconcilbacillus cellulovorans TaxID=1906605 RepID=A0A2A6E0H6_9BACL|nr:MAG: urease accessory protein UreF [Candidatus Reconcilbacillus cellulovorans]
MSWLAFVQLLDSALPVGAFSHSFGLETLVQEGRIRDAGELRAFVRAMLWHAWSTTDALAVKASYVYGASGEWERVFELDRLLHAQRIAPETREGMVRIGRRLLSLVTRLHPRLDWEPLAGAVAAGRTPGAFPTVFGFATYRMCIPLAQAAEGYLYTCVAGAANAALRLMSIGQTEAQAVIAELASDIRDAWRAASGLDPFDYRACAPLADAAMLRHETLYSRLFMS